MTHRTARRLLAAAAGLGLMGAAAAADPAPPAGNWYERLTGKPKAVPADGTFAATPKAYAPLDPGSLKDAFRAESDALARRLEVCTRLQQAAAARGDDKLASRAADLEKLATELFKARTARLGVKDNGGAP